MPHFIGIRSSDNGTNGKHQANGQSKTQAGGGAKNGRGGLYREELLGHVKALCGTVGFSLSKGVLLTVAKVEDPDKIRDMGEASLCRIRDYVDIEVGYPLCQRFCWG